MPRARPEPPVKRRLRPGHGDGHTCAHTIPIIHERPRWCVVGSSFISFASLASRLSIAHRRHVQRASSALVRSSSHGRGRLAPQAARDAVSRWARCGARLGRADPRLAAPRAESNLHPRVPTGPASPCSPPLVTALWLVRGSIRAIVSSAGGEAGGDGTLGRAPPWAFESRGPAAALSVARRALGCCLRPARSLYNAVGCREVVPDW